MKNKYTAEFCKNNKIAIRFYSNDEFNKCMLILDKNESTHRNIGYFSCNFQGTSNTYTADSDNKWYVENNYEIITASEFLQHNKYAEKWYINPKTSEECKIIREWFNNTLGTTYTPGCEGMFNWCHPTFNDMDYCISNDTLNINYLKDYKEISFEQFLEMNDLSTSKQKK